MFTVNRERVPIFDRRENTVLVSLAPGEEFVESLSRLCREQGIKLAAVSGIGAVNLLDFGAQP